MLILLCAAPRVDAADMNLDSLYACIDDAIAHSDVYVSQHESLVAKMHKSLSEARNVQDKYALSYKLYGEYKSFMNDSALACLNRCIGYATQMHRPDLIANCRSLMAFQCSSTGYYVESLQLLGMVSPNDFKNKEELSNYYIAYFHVYNELSYFTKLEFLRSMYQEQAANYRKLLYATLDKNSEDYLLRREMELFNAHRYDEALAVNNMRLAKVKPGSHEFAIVAYYRYLIYHAQNRMELSKYWLCQSALSDIRNAVMDQASLIELALILNGEGEYDRSYDYVCFTWNCNSRFSTRMRSWQMTPILSVINNNYQKQTSQTNRHLTRSLVAVSLLTLLLVMMLVFFYLQKKKLSDARNKLNQSNLKLVGLNDKLSVANENLDVTNQKLSTANHNLSETIEQLNEANRVKEEYIGRFLSLSSQYVDKLDDYRKMVNRKMKNKELDELYKISKSTEFKDKELDELYANFDSLFLHIFPDFVEQFNALLKPDERVHPKDASTLTTDLRIFALIRLGIDDSSRIAEFLHYSVNTIYNYRARIKRGVLQDKDDFEGLVKKIGMPSS